MKGLSRLHPWLLAFYPAWSLYVLNPELISLAHLGGALGASLVLAGLLWFLFRRLAKDSAAADLATSLCLVLFFSLGRVDSAMGNHGAGFLPLLYLAILILGLLWIRQRRRSTAGLHLFLTTAILCACLLGGLRLATRSRAGIAEADRRPIAERNPGAVAELGYLPDIYMIILDGYARADVLEEHYDFDNGPFLSFLRRRGFFVAGDSFANHNRTYLSLASTLNLRTVEDLGEVLGLDNTSRTLPYQMIRDSRTSRFLRAKGYEFLQLSSTWGATLENPHADRLLNCSGGIFAKEFYRVLADTSALRLFSGQIGLDLARCHLRNFEQLEALPRTAGAKLILAHFIPPHHPYLFDRHGNIRQEVDIANQFDLQNRLWEQREDYLEQLLFVNRRMREVVETILRDSANPPIILLLSDHGPDLPKIRDRELRRRVRMANLITAHLPGQPNLFEQRMTSVNLLRAVLRHYFGADLPPVPDRAFYSKYFTPYDFEAVPLP